MNIIKCCGDEFLRKTLIYKWCISYVVSYVVFENYYNDGYIGYNDYNEVDHIYITSFF